MNCIGTHQCLSVTKILDSEVYLHLAILVLVCFWLSLMRGSFNLFLYYWSCFVWSNIRLRDLAMWDQDVSTVKRVLPWSIPSFGCWEFVITYLLFIFLLFIVTSSISLPKEGFKSEAKGSAFHDPIFDRERCHTVPISCSSGLVLVVCCDWSFPTIPILISWYIYLFAALWFLFINGSF